MNDALALAFDRATGRDAGIEPVAPALQRFAGRVVEVARRIAALPACPRAVLARALEVATPRVSPAAALWRLVFDSWHGAVPAMRGASRRPRFLQFGGRGGRLDLEMVVDEDEGVRLRGTLDGPVGPVVLDFLPRSGDPVRVPVRAGGAFSATLPAGTGAFSVAVRSGRRTVSRTGRIPPLARP